MIAPDWRGFGRTFHRAPGYWFPEYLADLDDLLSKYSPTAPVRLVGHSMGGNIGGLHAGAMPGRVHFEAPGPLAAAIEDFFHASSQSGSCK